MDFNERRALALRILNESPRLTRRAGAFLGQVAVDSLPLTEKQMEWLDGLAAALPVEGGGA